MKLKKKKIDSKGLFRVLPFAMICIITGMVNPVFFSWANIVDLLRSTSFLLIVGVGVTFVLLGASLDMSVGSVMGLSGAICGLCLVNGVPVIVSVIAGLAAAALVGVLNSVMIIEFEIPALIATLGTMYVARGTVNVLTKGEPYYPLPDAFKRLGQGTIGSIPYSVFIALAIVLLAHFIVRKTHYGRSLMAVGGNKEAARLSGINTKAVLTISHIAVSVLAGFVGILLASRLSSAQPNCGDGWEMTAVAACIIGGTSMYGGYGSMLGTIVGCALMETLSNAMVLLRVSVYWQKIAIGLIMVVAVGIDTFRLKKTSGK